MDPGNADTARSIAFLSGAGIISAGSAMDLRRKTNNAITPNRLQQCQKDDTTPAFGVGYTPSETFKNREKVRPCNGRKAGLGQVFEEPIGTYLRRVSEGRGNRPRVRPVWFGLFRLFNDRNKTKANGGTSFWIRRQLGVPPETRCEYIHVRSSKTSLFLKVSGGTPNFQRIVGALAALVFVRVEFSN